MENHPFQNDPYPTKKYSNQFANCEFGTQAIHTGQQPDPSSGAHLPPIAMTSTFIQDDFTPNKGFIYTRLGNPNFRSVEQQLCALEHGKYALVFSSGLAAINSVLSEVKAGDYILGFASCYGGTYLLLRDLYKKFGVNTLFTDVNDWDTIEQHLKEHRPKICLFESPTNPLMEIVDIKKMAILLKQYGCLSVIDNTFANPYHQNPLDLGIDVVIHSSTKYLGGHGDLIGGCMITNNETLYNNCLERRILLGSIPSPFDAWMFSRSLKTLHLRAQKHSSNAQAVAEYLSQHPLVSQVFYPGLESHEGHNIAMKQMKNGFSGMVSVEFKFTSVEQLLTFTSSLKLFNLAVSLGGVESLIEVPARMTHGTLTDEERAEIGLSNGLVRISIGIEEPADLIKDLKYALECVAGSSKTNGFTNGNTH